MTEINYWSEKKRRPARHIMAFSDGVSTGSYNRRRQKCILMGGCENLI